MIVNLTYGEARTIVSALRRAHSHAVRSRQTLALKYGADADLSKSDEWVGWLVAAYVKCGGDVAELRKERERV